MSITMRWLAAAALCLVATGALAGEAEERAEINRAAKADFLAGRFDELEATRERYRSTGEKTASGVPKLTVFYNSFASGFLYAAPSRLKDDPFRAQARLWVRARPRSTAAAIVAAKAETEIGWAIRGPGFASGVTEAQWKGFKAQLALAAAQLDRVAQTSRNDPAWYVERLRSALESGEGWERFSAIALEALELHPDQIAIHQAILRAMLPKWGGSYEAVEAATQQIVSRTKDRYGLEFYARAYWWLRDVELPWDLFKTSKASWPLMKQGLDDVVLRYPTDWNLNIYAGLACLSGDVGALSTVLDRLHGRLDPQVWPSGDFMRGCASAPARKRLEEEDLAHFAKPAPIPDETRARQVIAAAVTEDFAAGRFDRLGATYAAFLAAKATTASGYWKLALFYQGVAPLSMLYEAGARVDQPSFDALRKQTDAWLAAAPASGGAVIARARLHLSEAMELRHGRAQTALTAEQKAAKATDELSAARKLLDDSKAWASNDPEWWATALQVAQALHADQPQFDSLVAEAMARESTYDPLIEAVLARAAGPRSPASLPYMLQVMTAASPAGQANEVYARGVLMIARNNKTSDIPSLTELDWRRAKAGLDVLLARYPSQWNLNAAANLACLARERAVAAQLLGWIGDDVIEAQWSNWRAPKACLNWASDEAQRSK
ncbi:hypothetical protein [Hansschlegelia sp.]|uniref:hypothetical protein n=1 Tax=Hansschlegelia sp. TaxID=2041892 RepID=UPI002B8834BC|nr:hypothetical protein [Hansschlegelia sp.]HVI28052.1 hypothetical protein [Hansschlegelia sp.]